MNDHEEDRIPEQTIKDSSEETNSASSEKLSGLVGKLAAIYHGVPEDEPSAEPATESIPQAESTTGDSPVIAAVQEVYPPIVEESLIEHEDDTSRRLSRREREEAELYLSDAEARARLSEPSKRKRPDLRRTLTNFPTVKQASEEEAETSGLDKRQDTHTQAMNRALAKRRSVKVTIGVLVSLVVLVIVVSAGFALASVWRGAPKTEEVSYQSTIDSLDYQLANRLYIEHLGDDGRYHERALELLETHEEAIVSAYSDGKRSYDSAYDELQALALFMPLWPEEERGMQVRSSWLDPLGVINPEAILSDSFTKLANQMQQERNFRLGQQLMNLDMNAQAIPYLRAAAEGEGSLAETAADQLRRSESTYQVGAINNANNYKAAGDTLRARLVLEAASRILGGPTEIVNLLDSLPPVDRGEILLDITAMSMTYFNNEAYHEALLILDVGRDFLYELIEYLESDQDVSALADHVANNSYLHVQVTADDQIVRQERIDSYRRDIESIDLLEVQLRENIVSELRAKATALADQGKYRDARDTIDLALEFSPDDENLLELRTEYHNKTKLRLNSFITKTTASGFRVEKLQEASDMQQVQHKDVTSITSSALRSSLLLKDLPHRHNRFQGVFYLMDQAAAINVQIVISQGETELYRSAPLNEGQQEASFDFEYDFKQPLDIKILGSGSGSATRYTMMDDIRVLLDAYFYNDGTWDETAATSLHAEFVSEQEAKVAALESKIRTSKAISVYDELANDSFWSQLFGNEALQDEAVAKDGTVLEQVLAIDGRTFVNIKADTEYLRGKLYVEQNSQVGSGVVLMIEDQDGNGYFSPLMGQDLLMAELSFPVSGNFSLRLLAADGKPIDRSNYRLLLDGNLYDFDQAGLNLGSNDEGLGAETGETQGQDGMQND